MLLKSLKMINFRQFINEEIDFAADSERNVTVIMGENGAGKTTISQAFSWCLYGDTDFDDKLMLNKIVASQMIPNEEKTVKVQLDLIHSGIEYTIITEQNYKKEFSNKLKPNNVIRNIAYKN
ncbi:MAG: AAA family ATPase, partial [Actinobacteria bacterium]|nr:AAA family ATPase [Actinomycetota bacterium]